MSITNEKAEKRIRRHKRSRYYLAGSTARPRLVVFRSIKHIYAQIIDDVKGTTLCSASSNEKEMRDLKVNGGNKSGAKTVGAKLAERAKEKGISDVVFDRGGNKYHGRVKELGDCARTGGLKF